MTALVDLLHPRHSRLCSNDHARPSVTVDGTLGTF